VREVVKAFEELVPTSVLKDRALAIAIELRHPAYDNFYLVLAKHNRFDRGGAIFKSACAALRS
jgi:predicted nucleic acid-binding protein